MQDSSLLDSSSLKINSCFKKLYLTQDEVNVYENILLNDLQRDINKLSKEYLADFFDRRYGLRKEVSYRLFDEARRYSSHSKLLDQKTFMVFCKLAAAVQQGYDINTMQIEELQQMRPLQKIDQDLIFGYEEPQDEMNYQIPTEAKKTFYMSLEILQPLFINSVPQPSWDSGAQQQQQQPDSFFPETFKKPYNYPSFEEVIQVQEEKNSSQEDKQSKEPDDLKSQNIQANQRDMTKSIEQINSEVSALMNTLREATGNAVPALANQQPQDSAQQVFKHSIEKVRIDGYSQTRTYFFTPSYTAYEVHAVIDGQEHCVKRRYSNFVELHYHLSTDKLYMAVSVPPIPPKQGALEKWQSIDAKLLQERQHLLEIFLQDIAQHELLSQDKEFLNFLTKDQDYYYVQYENTFYQNIWQNLNYFLTHSINDMQDRGRALYESKITHYPNDAQTNQNRNDVSLRQYSALDQIQKKLQNLTNFLVTQIEVRNNTHQSLNQLLEEAASDHLTTKIFRSLFDEQKNQKLQSENMRQRENQLLKQMRKLDTELAKYQVQRQRIQQIIDKLRYLHLVKQNKLARHANTEAESSTHQQLENTIQELKKNFDCSVQEQLPKLQRNLVKFECEILQIETQNASFMW